MDFIRSILRMLHRCAQDFEPTVPRSTCRRWATLFALFLFGVMRTTSVMADSGWCIHTVGYTYQAAYAVCQTNMTLNRGNSYNWVNLVPCYVAGETSYDGNGYAGNWDEGDYSETYHYWSGTGAPWFCGGTSTLPSSAKANGQPPVANVEGDPINAGNGNVYRRDEDFQAGRWLRFARNYNSAASAGLDTIGQHWRHSYSSHLTYVAGSSGTGTATIAREDGRVSTYQLSSGVWQGEPDIPDALTEQTDSSGNPTGWTLLRVDTRSTEQFNASGQLTSVQDVNGLVTTLNYSTSSTPTTVAPGAGYLISVADPQHRTIQLTYNGNGLINQIMAPDGSVYAYAYDSSNDLQTVTYPGGKTWTYLYGESPNNGGSTAVGLLTGILDETGTRYFSYSYNASRQGINNEMAGGVESYSLTYNSDGSVDVVDPLGVSRHHTFITLLGVPYVTGINGICESCSNISTWTYDFNGFVNKTTDYNGNVTTYQHDIDGMESARGEGSIGGANAQRTTTTTWNDTFHVPTERLVYNSSYGLISKTDWIYNALGEPLARCEIDDTVYAALSYVCSSTSTLPAGVRRSTYTYCTAVGTGCPLVGLMLTATGSRTDLTQTTTYTYYTSSSATNCGTPGAACYQAGDLHTVTDPSGHITTIASYDADGRITRLTDANGINTDLTYTPRGWLASRTVGGAQTSFGYTPYGAVSSVTDPDGVTTTYGYDAAHRLTKITDAQGNTVQYTLDAAGDKTAEQTYDATGTVHKSLSRTFNTLGQLTSVVDGLSHTVFNASATTSYDANGNLVQSTDGLGIQRQLGYDALNRLVQTLDNYNGTN